jgi:predicted acylesterase/phospholipase RssA
MRLLALAPRGVPVICLLAALAVAACASVSRRPAPPTRLSAAAPLGFPATVRSLATDRRFFLTHLEELRRRVGAARGGGPFNILALSGGGAGGAFGAGALVGLGRRAERPQFTVVTGVSTGALLAPFAFLGPAWDQELTEAFASARTEHLLRSRGIGVLFRSGVYQSKPLLELVDHYVTDAMIREVAAQYEKGRVLLVATTDLDKEETTIWDMGAIASHGGEPARTLFRDVLAASASIPGLFPPVLIRVSDSQGSYDEMHVDGGTSAPFFFTWEVAQIMALDAEELKNANLYVIINGQLGTTPQTTRDKTIPVLRRSFSTQLMHALRATLEAAVEYARIYGMNLRFARIPVEYPYRGPLNFKPEAMQALFNYAAGCAVSGKLWSTAEQALARTEQTMAPGACPGEPLGAE